MTFLAIALKPIIGGAMIFAYRYMIYRLSLIDNAVTRFLLKKR